ncbi:MAG TPA: transglycosylase SLT domain-containing protein [Spirochaetota bacterium]|nr:transglycosylase SLT domain-containing protein [Spirochaetota bacterium]
MKNIKFTSFIFLLILSLITCNQKAQSFTLSYNPFYASDDEIISKTEKNSENFFYNYILARSFQNKKEFKNAILYYANSAFMSKYNFSLKLFPQPVYAFLNSYSSKSPYYDDAVFAIASIFYQYNEFEYVVKFLSLIKKDKSALYRDSILLKSKAFQRLKKYDQSIRVATELTNIYNDETSLGEIYIRLGSVYEEANYNEQAINSYLFILRNFPESWHSEIAIKRILYILSKKEIPIHDSNSIAAICEALIKSKNFADAQKFLEKESDNQNKKIIELKVRVLANISLNSALAYLKNLRDDPDYEKYSLALANEIWNKDKATAIAIYKNLANSNNEEINKRVLQRLAFYYEERSNPEMIHYMDKYISLFPSDKISGRFLWLAGRYYLKINELKKATEYFTKSVKKYPENFYSAASRYWLFKIKKGNEEEYKEVLADLAFFTPESAYTIIALDDYSKKFQTEELRHLFEECSQKKQIKEMILYHNLLFMKEGYNKEWEKRISQLNDSIEKYSNFNNFYKKSSYKTFASARLNDIEKYFAAGDIDSINREIAIIQKSKEAEIDLSLAMSRLSSKYNCYEYSVIYSLRLLELLSIKENISLFEADFSRALYPCAFFDCVKKESQKNGLSPAIVLAVMRAESNFNHRAISPVGAVGLMQLMPTTARGIAKQIGITDSLNLQDPCTSIKLGSYYIKWLYNITKDSTEKMVAAYNAGIGNVLNWESRFQDKSMDYYSEFIPFNETRSYIFFTKKFMIQYSSIYNFGKGD